MRILFDLSWDELPRPGLHHELRSEASHDMLWLGKQLSYYNCKTASKEQELKEPPKEEPLTDLEWVALAWCIHCYRERDRERIPEVVRRSDIDSSSTASKGDEIKKE